MTDIKPQWRLLALTEMFGPCGIGWYYETVKTWTEEHEDNNEISCHVLIKLYYKDNEEWSKGVEGQGGSMLIAQETRGPHHSDEAYKMATTDALSVACKQIGIASDIYMGYSNSKYAGAKPDGNPATQRVVTNPKGRGVSRAKIIGEIMTLVNQLPELKRDQWPQKIHACNTNEELITLKTQVEAEVIPF